MKIKLALLLIVALLAACSPQVTASPTPTEDSLTGRLTFAGSTTMQPLVSHMADEFRIIHPNVVMEVAAGGSSVGIQAMHDGTADIGMASRNLTSEELEGIKQYIIAIDVLAIVIHPDNPVNTLTIAQIQDIYFGNVTNWQELGGPDLVIVPVQREVSSGSRGAFDEIVLEKQVADATNLVTLITAGDVAAKITTELGSIGYVGFGNLDTSLKVLQVGGILPTQESAKDGTYPLVRPLILLTGPLSQPLAQTFIDYVLSDEGQRYVNEYGWIPVK